MRNTTYDIVVIDAENKNQLVEVLLSDVTQPSEEEILECCKLADLAPGEEIWLMCNGVLCECLCSGRSLEVYR